MTVLFVRTLGFAPGQLMPWPVVRRPSVVSFLHFPHLLKNAKSDGAKTWWVILGLDEDSATCKSALNPPVVCSTDSSKAVVPVLVLLFVALWFILWVDLLYVFPCVILFLCFSVLLVLRLPRLGKRELILVFFVRLFGLCLFRFVGFLFLLGSGKGCGLWLWHSLDFSLSFFFRTAKTVPFQCLEIPNHICSRTLSGLT